MVGDSWHGKKFEKIRSKEAVATLLKEALSVSLGSREGNLEIPKCASGIESIWMAVQDSRNSGESTKRAAAESPVPGYDGLLHWSHIFGHAGGISYLNIVTRPTYSREDRQTCADSNNTKSSALTPKGA